MRGINRARVEGLFLANLVALALANKVSYDGFQALRLPIGNDSHTINEIISRFKLGTWEHTRSFADVLVPPHQLDALGQELQAAGLNATVLHQDVQASIAAGPIAETKRPIPGQERVWLEEWFADYRRLEDHFAWMEMVEGEAPEQVKLMEFGRSAEDRPIRAMQLRQNNTSGAERKPAVVFHGTVHAREWITAMVVEYAALYLLAGEPNPRMWDYDYYFFPIVNPDGFRHSHEVDRLWRKSREVNDASSAQDCHGIDLNRHWPHMWDIGDGASDQICDETFRGFQPGTAKETQSLIKAFDYIKEEHGSIGLYVDWHSYSQLFLSPYGHSCQKRPENHDDMQQLMKGASKALKKSYKKNFKWGPICESLYQCSGSSTDYVYDVQQAHNAFSVELRPGYRNTGVGFLLPPEQIIPSAEEAWAAIEYMVLHMKARDGSPISV